MARPFAAVLVLALVLPTGAGGAGGADRPPDAPRVSSKRAGAAPALPDFNGDGYVDLAAGIPYEDVGSTVDAGALSVLYGSPAGPQADVPDDQFWTQGSNGMMGQADQSDRLGRGLTSGDFNGDGFSDLAAGAFGEDVGAARAAGAVAVLYGSTAGLQADAPDDQLWTQDSPGVQDQADQFDAFGWSLGTGDFNADGFDDLAIDVRYEDVDGFKDAGAVEVLYGSAGGLQADAPDDQFWTQDTPGVRDQSEAGDEFGRWLTSGDFNADGFADLAAGTRREDVGSVADGGAVNVLYGSVAGLQADSPDDQFWTQNTRGVKDVAEQGDWFGNAVSGGDLNADGFDDLGVSAMHESVGSVTDAGSVTILYGSAGGLQADAPDDQFWTQDSTGVQDQAEVGDELGVALAIADFNADGYGDMAMGVLKEDVGTAKDAGAVNVLYGSAYGLQADAPDDQYWTQDSTGVQDVAEFGDEFGHTFMAAALNDDVYADLAIGSPHEDVGTLGDAGAISVLFGSAGGLQADLPDDQFWTQDSPGVQEQAEKGDTFGRTLGGGGE